MKKSAHRPIYQQTGIIFIPLFFILVVIGVTTGVIGVKTGFLKLTAAPSNLGSPIGPYDREPTKSTPTPNPSVAKPTLTPQVANKKAAGAWQTYQSQKYGYSVTYPIDWSLLDGNTETSRAMLVKDNANLGYVDIQSYFDKTLGEAGKLQEALNAMEQKLKGDPELKNVQFKSSIEGKIGGYIATGEQTLNGEQFSFENRGLLGISGKILLFHGAYKKIAPKDYLQKIEKIIESFKTD